MLALDEASANDMLIWCYVSFTVGNHSVGLLPCFWLGDFRWTWKWFVLSSQLKVTLGNLEF